MSDSKYYPPLKGTGPVKLTYTKPYKLSAGGDSVRITPKMADLLWELQTTPFISYIDLIEILWPDPDTQPLTTKSSIAVYRTNLNRILSNTNISIVTVWGRGLYLVIDPLDTAADRA